MIVRDQAPYAMVSMGPTDRQKAFISPPRHLVLPLTITRKEGYRPPGLRLPALFQVDGARLPTAARLARHSSAPCSGPCRAWGCVDLGGLAGTHRVPREVFLGCFMEIILWAV